MSKKQFVVWFDEVDKEDIALVGGKGANLGEMTRAGIPVPQGFIVTAPAYFYFVKENNLEKKVRHTLHGLDVNDPHALHHASMGIKRLVMNASLPKDLAVEILKAYHKLRYYDTRKYHSKRHVTMRQVSSILEEPLVAVRSSATAEDLPTASFAGQQATFLNVAGDVALLDKVKACYASLFEARAIFYRHENNFDHLRVGIAVPVQKMVQSDASGVMFTIDPITNSKHTITIEAIVGLGELIVQGSVTPDHYEVDKKTLVIGKKNIEKQTRMLVKSGKNTKETPVPKARAERQKISDKHIEEIARLGKKIEHHYFFPQDIEWAIEDDKIYVVQTRPITTIANRAESLEVSKDQKTQLSALSSKLLLRGDPASPGIGSGPVKLILSASQISKIKPGDVLVAPKTSPDYVPAMRKAAAIITDWGGRTSHAAIVSRELGVPCVVGTDVATKKLRTGLVVTVNGTTGEVFKGSMRVSNHYQSPGLRIAADKPSVQLETKTKVYVNLAEPERAADVAQMDVDGVGLLRAEFMIANIGIHPMKMIADGRSHLFIDTLASDLATFCKAFVPRPVVYRLSDFKTNEYRNLKGGAEFEPQEENPMLGFRGAHRFIANPKALKLEIDAIKKVRNEMEFTNLWLMIPYIRTVAELIAVKKLISSFGLHQNSSFKLWIMLEIPSNVILIEKFLAVGIDGVSIGSNDLTMLTLGTDRDNSELAKVFSERDEAVVASLERVITACRKGHVTSSICGQAPSSYPDLVEKLVGFGITSISVNPDALASVRKTIYNVEARL